MAHYLINCSNLRKGGGVQVADSVCRELYKYPNHRFLVVYSQSLVACATFIEKYDNIETYKYDIPMSIVSTITGRNKVLDELVNYKKIDAVLTIFGPSRWNPKVPHLCGFARPQLVIPESPFWNSLNLRDRIKYSIKKYLMRLSFKRCSNLFWTESSFISLRLNEIYPHARVYTITNNYNQVFDNESKWDTSIRLPQFEGITLLTISANYPHKNLKIIIPTIEYLLHNYKDLKFRFILTLKENQFPRLNKEIKDHILFVGPVTIEQCPFLYIQSDVMFLPSLLECFSASYAEAMKMKKPILTSNLEFAKALCGDAALYFDAVSEKSIGDAIYNISINKELSDCLVKKGLKQLLKYDSYVDRTRKIIEILDNET